jgi:hypothetical protein
MGIAQDRLERSEAINVVRPRWDSLRSTHPADWPVTDDAEGTHTMAIISVLIGILIIVVVGAICFWAIEKFATDRRLANLLKLLVVLVCLGAIVQRLLILTY